MKDGETREYTGARGAKFAVFPGSVLARRGPTWVMVAELVETTRLWGRTAAAVDLRQVEPLAEHLVKRSYGDPRWDRRRAAVVASEQVTLYGLPIVKSRTVQYGRIDPAVAREMFIRRALVEGDWDQHHAFMRENERRVEEVEALEARARRRDLLASEAVRAAFFEARLPEDVVSGRHFDRWWKRRAADPANAARLPDGDVDRGRRRRQRSVTGRRGGSRVRWSSAFRTASIPARRLTASPSTSRSRRSEKCGRRASTGSYPHFARSSSSRCCGCCRSDCARRWFRSPMPQPHSLPTSSRAPAHCSRCSPRRSSGCAAYASVPTDWSLDPLPAHLRMTFSVEDEDGSVLASGRSLDALRDQLRPAAEGAPGAGVAGLRASWNAQL